MVSNSSQKVVNGSHVCDESMTGASGETIRCGLVKNRSSSDGENTFHVPLAHFGSMKSGVPIAWHDNGESLGI